MQQQRTLTMTDNEVVLPGSSPDAELVSVETKLSSLLSEAKAKKLWDQSLTPVLEQIMETYMYIRDEVTDQGKAREQLERMGYLLATHGFVDHLYYNIVLAPEGDLQSDPGRTNLGKSRELLCRLTDKCTPLCQTIAASPLMEIMIKNLSVDTSPGGENDDMGDYTMRTTLQMLTLYNVLYKCPGSKHQFRKWGGVEVMMNFVQSDSKPVKAAALLTVALAADLEADRSRSEQLLESTESNINYMLWLVDECLIQPEHRTSLIDKFFRFRLDSLLSGLVCLSRNRSNALAIGRNGGLDRFERILRSENSSLLEIQYTAETIWNLSFQDDNKPILKRSTNLMKLIQDLEENEDTSIKMAAEGTYLELYGRPSEEKDLVPEHVMISYNCNRNDQKLAKKLMKKLKAEGINVLMDEATEGDQLEKKAQAVENSHAVILCLSEAYRDSPNCRMEATYAVNLGKPTVPVLMEEGFAPSGWLGFILGGSTRYDLTKDFDAHFGRILTYLRKVISEDEAKHPAAAAAATAPRPKPRSQSIGPKKVGRMSKWLLGGAHTTSVEDWSCEQVATWWRDTAQMNAVPVEALDGRLLAELKKWRTQAPEFFLVFAKQELRISDPLDLIRFSAAIQVV